MMMIMMMTTTTTTTTTTIPCPAGGDPAATTRWPGGFRFVVRARRPKYDWQKSRGAFDGVWKCVYAHTRSRTRKLFMSALRWWQRRRAGGRVIHLTRYTRFLRRFLRFRTYSLPPVGATPPAPTFTFIYLLSSVVVPRSRFRNWTTTMKTIK